MVPYGMMAVKLFNFLNEMLADDIFYPKLMYCDKY